MEATQCIAGVRGVQNCAMSQAAFSGRSSSYLRLPSHTFFQIPPPFRHAAGSGSQLILRTALRPCICATQAEALGVDSEASTAPQTPSVPVSLPLDTGQVPTVDENVADIFRPARRRRAASPVKNPNPLIFSGRKPIDPSLPPLARGARQQRGPVRRPIESSKQRKERLRHAFGVARKVDDSHNSAHAQRLLDEVSEAEGGEGVVAALQYWYKCLGASSHDLTFLIATLRQKRLWGRTVQVRARAGVAPTECVTVNQKVWYVIICL